MSAEVPAALDLDVAAARGVHALLAGRPSPLAAIVAATRERRGAGPVSWRIPLGTETVHRLEGLLQLAGEEGAAVELLPAGPLDARQRAFVADLGVAAWTGAPTGGQHRPARELAVMVRWVWRWLTASAGPRTLAAVNGPLPRVVLIGAYGGDHVGDTAILGGVLLALAARHGTTRATLLSHRADHTARLAAGLVTPVELEVLDYDRAPLSRLLAAADAVVVAGGPVMDLPKVLLRHLAVAAAAARRGVPLLVERVGIGPFRRAASRWAARRLLHGAAAISVRSAAACHDPVLRGLRAEVGRDPAFDYLASRLGAGRASASVSAAAAAAVAELLRGSETGVRIGINLRPIRHLWSRQGVAYSRAAYAGFLERFAAGLVRAQAAAPRPLHFVFYPMNPIRFGLSDLEAAYRLQRQLAGRVDLRVWEADPDVDDLVHLLGQLDAAVAMRLHAAIFAVACGLPVLGLDYYPGQGGKVEALFADLGRPEAVRRIDTFDADWLSSGLAAVQPRAERH